MHHHHHLSWLSISLHRLYAPTFHRLLASLKSLHFDRSINCGPAVKIEWCDCSSSLFYGLVARILSMPKFTISNVTNPLLFWCGFYHLDLKLLGYFWRYRRLCFFLLLPAIRCGVVVHHVCSINMRFLGGKNNSRFFRKVIYIYVSTRYFPPNVPLVGVIGC